VLLILGVLAAIALPVFFNQKGKASDTRAKATAHLAQVAMETCANNNGGGYASCDSVAALSAIQSTLSGAPITFPKPATYKAYQIRVASMSAAGQYFEVDRNSEGALSHPCATPGVDGCPSGGDWGSE
jgi:type II secretory pathway pseudopilin PulG